MFAIAELELAMVGQEGLLVCHAQLSQQLAIFFCYDLQKSSISFPPETPNFPYIFGVAADNLAIDNC